jgi:hypothetical protein
MIRFFLKSVGILLGSLIFLDVAYLRESMSAAALNMDSFEDAYQQADWSEYEGMPLFKAANRINAYNVYLSIQSK